MEENLHSNSLDFISLDMNTELEVSTQTQPNRKLQREKPSSSLPYKNPREMKKVRSVNILNNGKN